MKAGIFDPYLDTLGGGEVYTLTFAQCLAKQGYLVDIFWPDPAIKTSINYSLNFNLDQFNFSAEGYYFFTAKKSLLRSFLFSRQYQLLFFLSDGSLPLLFAKKNILHFQVPFTNLSTSTIAQRLKLKNIHHIICNSAFTKKVIDQQLKVNAKVVYPPLHFMPIKSLKKQNIILNVGRFTDALHNKRQDVLIKTFKNMVDEGLTDWQLILIGSAKEGQQFLEKITLAAQGYPIKILPNVSAGQVRQAYAQAKIFWLATGFGINENRQPEKVEHFGLATVEAMAAGCVPVVINKGGQKEIVQDGLNGYRFNTLTDLKTKTLRLINNPLLLRSTAKIAQEKAQDFNQENFCHEVQSLLS